MLLKKAQSYFSKPGLAVARCSRPSQGELHQPGRHDQRLHSARCCCSTEPSIGQPVRRRYGYRTTRPTTRVGRIHRRVRRARFIFDGYKVTLGGARRPEYITKHFEQVVRAPGIPECSHRGRWSSCSVRVALIRGRHEEGGRLQPVERETLPNEPERPDRLGTALLAKGDKQKALEAFEKSLALKPNTSRRGA